MYSVSSAFLKALRSPSMVTSVQVTGSDGTTFSINSGSVTMDSRRNITRTAELELTATASKSASEIYDLVMTPGLEITIKRGLQLLTTTQTGTRTNLITNPSMEATSGYATVRANLVTNPSFETGLASWGATRVNLTQDTANPVAGTSTGKMVVNAVGFFPRMIQNSVGVTVGTTYTASAYMTIASATQSRIAIQWLDSTALNQIGSLAEVTVPTVVGGRLSVTATAPASAAYGRIFLGFPDNTPVNETLGFDAVLLEASPTVGDYFDGATTASGDFSYAWTGTANASTSIQRGLAVAGVVSDWAGSSFADYQTKSDFRFGTSARKSVCISTATLPTYLHSYSNISVTAGKTYTWSYYVKPSVTRTFRAKTSATGTDGPWITCPANTWTRVSHTFTIATTASIKAFFNSETSASIGDTYIFDGALFEETATLGNYFDGATDGCSWTGTANASTSNQPIFTLGTSFEYVPLGVFSTDSASIDRRTSGVVKWSGSDRSKKILRARFTDPYQINANTTLAAAGTSLLQSRWANVVCDFANVTNTVTAQIIYEAGESSDPWEQARRLFSDHGYDLNFDGNGNARAVLIPDPASSPSVFDFGNGDTNLVLSAETAGSLEKVYNGVIATGEGTSISTPLRGEAWDTNPTSPTYYLGNYGKVPLFYSSPLLTTAAIAQQAATTLLSKLKGRVDQLSWETIVNPALEPLDVITMNVRGVNTRAVIDSLTIPLKAGDAMTAQARQAI